MGLEAPLALLGLLGALLPWLAHRIRRRDLQPLPLPTLQLLERAESKKRRSRGLTDLLLLALRVALVAIASIAIAAPYVTARLTFGDGSVASAAIVIDDSLSMQRREDGDTLLAQALARARRAIESLPAGSELSLIAGGRPARVLARRGSDPSLALLELERLAESGARGTDLGSAIKLAVQQLDSARHPVRRLLVLSDFAAHSGLSAEQLRLEGIQVTLQRIGAATPPANLYLSSLRALPDPAVKGQTSLAFELMASGAAPARVTVRVFGGGQELGKRELALSGGQARGTLQVAAPEVEADPTASVRIEADDALLADNTAGVLLRASDAVHVMLVNGDPHPASSRDELHYALPALRLSTLPGSADDRGSFSLRIVDGSALAKYDLTQVDVVVLANTALPDGPVVQRLVRFVEQGGGLLVATGDHVDPRAYNTALDATLPCRLRARVEQPDTGFAEASSRLLPPGPSGLSRAVVRKRMLLECQSGVELRFSDGSPAVAIADVGRGRSGVLATTLDADWSDLPLRPGYLPLLARLIQDVARATQAISGPVLAGTPVKIAIPPSATRLEVVSPEGVRHPFEIKRGDSSIEFEQTHAPGAYRVLAASERASLIDVPRGAFVVETPRAESDLTPLQGIESWSTQHGAATGAGAKLKQSLAGYWLLAFALLVLVEGALRLRLR